ncbi:MAG TPA: DUF1854 domain-containing protein [Gemmataceae bacterium]|jgi:hypothetical protein|nr:DUF1854 domain-containing protein [Gemmataceae bacterium]
METANGEQRPADEPGGNGTADDRGKAAVHGDGRSYSPFTLHHDAWGRLVLTDAAGRQHVGVEPVRSFPISDPGGRISVCDADGHELVWVEQLDDLPALVRWLLQEHLARREFLPVLRRILRITTMEPVEWEVETDRGRTRFLLNSEDDVRRLDDHRALIIDAHGIRYFIPDTRALDAPSRRMLERYL